MSIHNIRKEVMQFIEKDIDRYMDQFLIPVEKIWQPSDFLPDSQSHNFFEEITELRELAKDLPDDFWITLIGDTITEEALPTYESWLMQLDGVVNEDGSYIDYGWAKWIRHWTGEENRHGDLLNKYLYLSGRINMREVEISTHYLINDGFDIGTSHDPYKNFVYTSFQELATYISHNNVSRIAKNYGAKNIARMCKIIAGDEMRHHLAYTEFVRRIFEVDPSEMMLAVQYMFRLKIVMPAHFLRESGDNIGKLFEPFSDAAQRIGVYTAFDYVDIMEKLIKAWKIDKITNLTEDAEKARDFIMKFPERMRKISERINIPDNGPQFKWLIPAHR
ncbi:MULTISPECIES: acyl-ACP desaturase [Weeksella]|uniref:Acyl-(Acyl-carrier-protein) desaturase n=1 Tax=Weeksella virosa (strain ATCC 43766 / DSM 16922 / JCM 21250 / CCUG 30538 / CDC 9751 / IAM 14551 / NBRC 16016 / NCTC 11634 / CL345/78) TaxID=865938 RepID=F0NXN6_WEEVC|nr:MULTISPECIES: acyl-ACP desaturase [Weeksella]ADX66943.1 acyl-(acyl-carrier-protein) desaturase [Weeksella virosa DSM 16922]MDK7375709.1 acyl-ACP desaturase [Weeksella virosa]MDK7674930.1 acyl-ACP desaturase [Weeksella virosa]OFM84191.1 fatty acid desaturase [Weeksella sp. HMSC059D05]SUP53258.1 Putative acyl-[acyl-carrier-protein] desaturase desA1 [Weeksella virosa]